MGDEFLAMGRQVLAAQPFSALLGLQMAAFTPGDVTLTLALQPAHLQHDGAAHDGVLGTLVATGLLFAGGSALGTPVVLAGYTLTLFGPVAGGTLRAQAHATPAIGSRHAGGRCEVWATVPGPEAVEVLVAVAVGTIVPRET